ncbi:hypothetical protein [Reichenbachiella ulvae]|uniref:Lipoprotein n=1 Tax=Reichenbachiella ulvae TaxID=2980104 RepID=A0ABT3CNP3_9BACT|nr:hypothetical protein [Reichenbachiella ulvae]MCV9385353.1 hypothetical protein [Reichenbachiella ulvae]
MIKALKYRWLAPLLVLTSCVLGWINNAEMRGVYAGLMFFSVLFLIHGVLCHWKYIKEHRENQ